MERKSIFSRLPLELYKRMEKIRIDTNLNQRKFLQMIITEYVEKIESEETNKNES